MYSRSTIHNSKRTYPSNSQIAGTAPKRDVSHDPMARGPRARFESFQRSLPEQVTTYRPFRHRAARWRFPQRTVRLTFNGESRLPFLAWRQRRIWCCVGSLQPYDVMYLHSLDVSTCGLRMLIFICYLPRYFHARFLLRRRIYVRRTELRFLACKLHASWDSGGPGRPVRGRAGKVLPGQWEMGCLL